MIQDYEKKYELAVDGLGRLVSSSYDARMLGEYEKILVYTKEDDVIGFIQYSKLYEVVDILYIAVDERFRHLGVGSELIDRLCRDLEIKKIIERRGNIFLRKERFHQDSSDKELL